MKTLPGELDEKNFIQEKGPKLMWAFLILFLTATFLLWGLKVWERVLIERKQVTYPFYQVTHRDFSLFLWQNPEFIPEKGEALFSPELAETYVSAPKEVLFYYHAWHRLLGMRSLAKNPIDPRLYHEFLVRYPQWRGASQVDLAYQGWLNYTHQWDEIEQVSEDNVGTFLEKHPFYARNYWQNLFPDYLEGEMPSFLKAALFNFKKIS